MASEDEIDESYAGKFFIVSVHSKTKRNPNYLK